MANESVRLTIPVAYNIPGKRIGGINLDDESIGFGGQFSPFLKNMIVEKTRLRKRLGYTQLGSGTITGVGTRLISYIDATGEPHLILITTTKAYQFNPSTLVWDDVSGPAWTGDADDRFSFTVATDTATFTNNGGSALLVVNNIDDIQYFEGDAADTFATLVHGFPSFASCVAIEEFWNHLFVIGFTDSAVRARGFAWSGLSDVTDWTGVTSNAGTLTDSIGALINSKKLGTDLVIYSDRSISLCKYVGGSSIYVIPTIIYETGLFAHGAICNLIKTHYFLGTNQRIYSLQPGGVLNPIGQRMEKAVFAAMAIDLKTRNVAGYDVDRDKVLFATPHSGSDYPKHVFVLNTTLVGQPWEYYEFAHDVRAIATLRRTGASAYCDDAEWTDRYCDETPGFCDDSYGQQGFDMCCFLSSDGTVYKLDEASGYDDTSDIDCEVQTEDIVLSDEENFARFVWFSFSAYSQFASITALIYYSTDKGENWTQLANSPVTLQQEWTTHRLPLDVVGRRIRFRIVQNGFGDLQLRSNYRVLAVPLPERD